MRLGRVRECPFPSAFPPPLPTFLQQLSPGVRGFYDGMVSCTIQRKRGTAGNAIEVDLRFVSDRGLFALPPAISRF